MSGTCTGCIDGVSEIRRSKNYGDCIQGIRSLLAGEKTLEPYDIAPLFRNVAGTRKCYTLFEIEFSSSSQPPI